MPDLKRILIIGYFATIGACVVVFAISAARSWSLSTELVGFLTLLASGSLAGLKDAGAFEFGSTRGSQAKDQTITNLTANGKETPHV